MYDFFKRFFDIFLSFISLILLFPIILIISTLVLILDGRPILFKDDRSGLNNRTFKILKFRTMHSGSHKFSPTTSKNDPRITNLGKFLRRFKLDELPQLINVLKGEMSFVGPRPEMPSYTKKYNVSEQRILSVRPGITDLASLYFYQMNKLIDDSDPEKSYMQNVWSKKNSLRIEYVDNKSLSLDIKIFFKTLFFFLSRRS